MGPRLAEACRSWPAGTPARDLFRPLRSTIPTLVLSGEADPATTPASADRLVRTLRNAAHIRMPGVAHGPMIPECVQAAAGRFIAQASVSGLQDTCRSGTLPPFFVPPQGAPAAAK
jgi:pimeloyl-ACP methyl ester carboxylesterase